MDQNSMKFDIKECKNPRYSAADNSRINVDLYITHDDGAKEVWPFTADPNDCSSYGKTIFDNAKNGDYGVIAPYQSK